MLTAMGRSSGASREHISPSRAMGRSMMYERLARRSGARFRPRARWADGRPAHYAGRPLSGPTTKASFGIHPAEAMACGTPMLVSDITGFRELVGDGTEAMLVPQQRPTAWAEAILDLLADRPRLEAMGAAGRRKAETFAWPRITDQVMRVYQRVVH